MACYSTIIALATVLADYIEHSSAQKISYQRALLFTLLVTGIIANLGLSNIVEFSRPLIEIIYPLLIAVVILNILYKLFNFKPFFAPLLGTFIISVFMYFYY
jgi:LIVCS family branched-chain amino acid:cation transporter